MNLQIFRLRRTGEIFSKSDEKYRNIFENVEEVKNFFLLIHHLEQWKTHLLTNFELLNVFWQVCEAISGFYGALFSRVKTPSQMRLKSWFLLSWQIQYLTFRSPKLVNRCLFLCYKWCVNKKKIRIFQKLWLFFEICTKIFKMCWKM